MAPQLLFYERAVPVTTERHRDVAVNPRRDYGFARGAGVVPLTTAEVPAAAGAYAVVFVGEGDEVGLAAILGVRDGENLFVDDDGRWDAGYIPAFVRRYPFVFAQQHEANRLTLCVDEASDLLNREGRGERLFDSTGERTSYLGNVLDFMQRYQVALQRSRTFARRVQELDLLRRVQAQIRMGDHGGTLQLGGFRTVDRERLKALPAETVNELFASDGLEALYLHLASLRHLQGLGERAARRGAPKPRLEGTGDDAIDGGDILLN
ncbi:MAG: multidrug transporter [Alphaproteobacteria bacterium]|jgi:hypothetical protein|nr:multidrug transporter [Alphaproteobacteria bacterium]